MHSIVNAYLCGSVLNIRLSEIQVDFNNLFAFWTLHLNNAACNGYFIEYSPVAVWASFCDADTFVHFVITLRIQYLIFSLGVQDNTRQAVRAV